jgi:hypothetical protein
VLNRDGDRYVSKLHLDGSSHAEAIKHVQRGSRVIDLGGGNGWIGKHLVTEKECQVTILDEEIHTNSIPRLTLHTHDLNRPLPPLGPTESVLLLDVLEHLDRRRQRELLGEIRAAYPQLPKLLITVPNTSFLPLRLVFLFTGRLNYGRRGILDETHRFLFSRHSLKELLVDSMFSIQSLKGLPPPFGLLPLPKWIASILGPIADCLVRISPGLFAYQWICVSTPMPSADSLLGKTKNFS